MFSNHSNYLGTEIPFDPLPTCKCSSKKQWGIARPGQSKDRKPLILPPPLLPLVVTPYQCLFKQRKRALMTVGQV
ncbi:hypothetical protein VTK26DRAFT_4088 [Humicola hyalothermophila]